MTLSALVMSRSRLTSDVDRWCLRPTRRASMCSSLAADGPVSSRPASISPPPSYISPSYCSTSPRHRLRARLHAAGFPHSGPAILRAARPSPLPLPPSPLPTPARRLATGCERDCTPPGSRIPARRSFALRCHVVSPVAALYSLDDPLVRQLGECRGLLERVCRDRLEDVQDGLVGRQESGPDVAHPLSELGRANRALPRVAERDVAVRAVGLDQVGGHATRVARDPCARNVETTGL